MHRKRNLKSLKKSVPKTEKQHTAEDRLQQIIFYVQHRSIRIYSLVAFLLVVTIASFLWIRHQNQQDADAQSELFYAVYDFEAGKFEQALTGTENYWGFLDIIKTYKYTKASNLAHLYAGICYMRQQQYEEAIKHLEKFKARDLLLQSRAWSLIGDALTEQKAYAQAASYYIKAADYKPNDLFTPTYLSKAALAHEANKNYQATLKCYQRIIQAYPHNFLSDEARKHISRLEALLQ